MYTLLEEESRMKVKVDETKCVCCGSCTVICGDVFGFSDDGTACVKDAAKVEENIDAVKEAADQCPTGAIVIEEK